MRGKEPRHAGVASHSSTTEIESQATCTIMLCRRGIVNRDIKLENRYVQVSEVLAGVVFLQEGELDLQLT